MIDWKRLYNIFVITLSIYSIFLFLACISPQETLNYTPKEVAWFGLYSLIGMNIFFFLMVILEGKA